MSNWSHYLVQGVHNTRHESLSFVKEVVQTNNAPAPIGPYNQAIKCGGMVYISGCIGMNAATRKLVEGGVQMEANEVMKNLKSVVEASGSSMNKVVKTTVLLTKMADFQAVNAIYAQYFDEENAPARACFAVAELPAGALVEIDAVCIA